jgi:hypothetical protein
MFCGRLQVAVAGNYLWRDALDRIQLASAVVAMNYDISRSRYWYTLPTYNRHETRWLQCTQDPSVRLSSFLKTLDISSCRASALSTIYTLSINHDCGTMILSTSGP